jgi:hypothetical protein
LNAASLALACCITLTPLTEAHLRVFYACAGHCTFCQVLWSLSLCQDPPSPHENGGEEGRPPRLVYPRPWTCAPNESFRSALRKALAFSLPAYRALLTFPLRCPVLDGLRARNQTKRPTRARTSASERFAVGGLRLAQRKPISSLTIPQETVKQGLDLILCAITLPREERPTPSKSRSYWLQ